MTIAVLAGVPGRLNITVLLAQPSLPATAVLGDSESSASASLSRLSAHRRNRIASTVELRRTSGFGKNRTAMNLICLVMSRSTSGQPIWMQCLECQEPLHIDHEDFRTSASCDGWSQRLATSWGGRTLSVSGMRSFAARGPWRWPLSCLLSY